MALLTTAQAADRLNISESLIRRYCRDGRLKAQRIGRDWLIEEGDLEQLERRKYHKQPDRNPQAGDKSPGRKD